MKDKWWKGWVETLEHMIMWGIIFLIVRWFIKNLFGKYFIFFWVYLGLVVMIYLNRETIYAP